VAAIALGAAALYLFRPQPTAPAIIAALPAQPTPAPVAEPPKPVPAAETPQPAPVVETPKPAPVIEAKRKPVEKKPARQAERQKLSEPPPMAVVEQQPAPVVSPRPAAPVYRGKVVSLDHSWGFAVVELAERGAVKVGDRLTATVASGRRVDMVVRRVSGNLASAVPDGRLSDDLVGASVTRN